MSAPASGRVQLGKAEYIVTVTSETARRSIYAVSSDDDRRGRKFRPAEVRVGIESVFACLVCQRGPRDECLHVAIVKKFVAAQPLEVVE